MNILKQGWKVLFLSGSAACIVAAGPVAAHDAPADNAQSRACILMSMVNPGGALPPHCDQQQDELDPEVAAQLDRLALAVLPFYSFDVALAAGWDAPLSGCVESPMGGMGYHYANIEQLVNGGKVSLLRPEVLLYAPTADGSMEFVAVEYVIPAEDWDFPEPPVILGQDMHFNPVLDLWALHVWIAKDNPNGIFDDWNPEVSCQFADD